MDERPIVSRPGLGGQGHLGSTERLSGVGVPLGVRGLSASRCLRRPTVPTTPD